MKLFERYIKLITKLKSVKLNSWNLILAATYAAQAIVILVVSNTRSLPVTTSYLAADPLASQAAGHQVLAAASHHIFDINLIYLVVAILFIAAIAHALVATTYSVKYEVDIQKGINKARWIESAFSASLMLVVIALLVGVNDLASLIMLFGLTAIMNLAGLIVEIYNHGKRNRYWLTNVISGIAGIVPWLVIAIYITSSGIYGNRLPAFVYWVVGSIFILFLGTSANMILQQRHQGKWSDYLYGERLFMILSLVAKTALAWQVFAGVPH